MIQKRNILPSIQQLEENFYYDESSTTCLRWNVDRPGRVKKDSEAGRKLKGDYSTVVIFNKKYITHRIIWKLYYKVEPPDIIDHIDGNKRNNNINNLREASHRQNGLNIKMPARNTSGAIGVYWMKSKNKWKVEIRMPDGTLKYFGTFSDFDKAKELAEITRNNLNGNWIRH